MPVRIAGAGCCLMDILYPRVDFSSLAFAAMRSRTDGDGGLAPGRLVFAEDAERFAAAAEAAAGRPARPFPETVSGIVGGAAPAAENLGGPSAVSLVHAAQMLAGEGIEVEFSGARGGDALGERLAALLARTPLRARLRSLPTGRTPSTLVLSDPSWDGGRGERCFVNEIGAAALFLPEELGEDFLGSDIVAFGGTALVPALHDGLPGLLAEARGRGALTVVNTVFDFRAERRDPAGPWPLGGRLDAPGKPGPASSYGHCDLLVADREEALRLAGTRELEAALDWLRGSGVGAFLVTRGAESVVAWAAPGGRFAPLARTELPVSERALSARAGCGGAMGDTTGCGDAFAGGVLAALALQLARGAGGGLDLAEAASWGIAAGGFTLSILGGTFFESRPGEKRALVEEYRADWLRQGGMGR